MGKRKQFHPRATPVPPGAARRIQSQGTPKDAVEPWGIELPIVALLAVTLLIKVTVAVQLAGHPMLQPVGTLDTAFYVEAAKRVAGGDWLFGTEAFYASPLYIYFLALIFVLAGPSLIVARVVQAAIGTVGVWLAMATARRWYNRQTALISGVLLSATGILTFYEVVILQSALDPALTALDGWLIARAARKDTPFAWGLAGAGLGLHALNRPNLLLCIVVLILFAGFRTWRKTAEWRAVSRVVAWAALGASLAIAPVTLRNYAVSGEAILITSHGGLNFNIGNHADADGAYQPINGITSSIQGQATDARRVVGEALGHKPTDREVSSYFYKNALDWIWRHPAAAVKLAGRKLSLLLNANSPSLNYSYAFYSQEEDTLLRALIVGPWLLVPLGLAGFVVSLRKGAASGIGVWAVVTAAYAASLILFFVTDRYQLPLLVPLAIAGGRAISYLWGGRREPARLFLPIATLAVVSVITNVNLGPKYDQLSEERARMAIALIQQGETSRAEMLLAHTEEDHRDPALLHYRAGLAYANQHHYDDAATHLRRALEIRPEQPQADLLLGQVLLDKGNANEAIPYLKRAISRDKVLANTAEIDLVRALVKVGRLEEASTLLAQLKPPLDGSPSTLVALGTIGLDLHQPVDAVRFLDAAAAKSPSDPAVIEKLAVALAMSGNLPGAMDALEKAVRLAPDTPSLHLNLAVTYAQAGRLDDARREAREALRLRSDYPQARDLLERLLRAR